jgi:hypothetical protein
MNGSLPNNLGGKMSEKHSTDSSKLMSPSDEMKKTQREIGEAVDMYMIRRGALDLSELEVTMFKMEIDARRDKFTT